MSDKEQVKLLTLQLKDYRQRLFQEETMRQKMYLEIEKFEQQHNEVLEENKYLLKELQEKNMLIQEMKRQRDGRDDLEEPISPQIVKERTSSLCESPTVVNESQSQIILTDIHSKLSEILKHSSAEEIKQENKTLKDALQSLQTSLKQAQKQVATADQILAQKDVTIGNLREQVREQQDQIAELQKHKSRTTPHGDFGEIADEISALPLINEADSFLFDQTQNWLPPEGQALPSTRETVADLTKVLDEYNNQGSDKQDLLKKQNEMLTRIMEMLNDKNQQSKMLSNNNYMSAPSQHYNFNAHEEKGYQSARSDPTRVRCETDPSDHSGEKSMAGQALPRQGSFNNVNRPLPISSTFRNTAPQRYGSTNGPVKGSLGLRSSIIGNILLQQKSHASKPPLRK